MALRKVVRAVCVCVHKSVCLCTPQAEILLPRVKLEHRLDVGRVGIGVIAGVATVPGRKAHHPPDSVLLGTPRGLLGACGGTVLDPGFVYTWTKP